MEKNIKKLGEELAEAKKQAAENLAGWQRARADYANFKRESEQKQQEIIEIIRAAFMAEFLPLYNHFKLALKHIPLAEEQSDWVKGIRQIQKEFQDFFKKYKIEEIKTIGEKFNPNWHEAVVYEEKEGFEPETIFEEVQPGYLVENKVLNPAQVKVAK